VNGNRLSRRRFLSAGAALGAVPALGLDEGGLVVHEWGVVTVPDGSALGMARSEGARFEDGKEIAEALPPFVETYPKAFAAVLEAWGNMEVRKPIVYFYSREKTSVSVRVSMPEGRPHAWWPAARDFGPKPDLPRRGLRPRGELEKRVPAPEEMKPERTEAVRTLRARGPLAFPMLREDAEVKSRLLDLLRR